MMKGTMLGLALVLMWTPLPSIGDIYKYVDENGQICFTDSPLRDSDYSLQWKRDATNVIDQSRGRLIASGRRILSNSTRQRSISPEKLTLRRSQYASMIDRAAQRFSLHPELLHAVIRAESAYNANAVSPAGAIGLMQLMPATAARYGVSDIYDPVQNIRGGAQYLRFLLDMFDEDLRLALAGYNAGENAVVKYGNQIPPYPETQQYVRRVMQYLWAERASAGS